MADAAAAAVDLILARRAWAVVVRDNDRDDNQACGGATAPSFSSSTPTIGVTTTLPEGKDMAGGGRGGPVVFPHPDDDNTEHLLDDMGSTNVNDDDNNDIPPAPPHQGRGARTTTVPAAAASRDAVATIATTAIVPRGARDLHAAAETW